MVFLGHAAEKSNWLHRKWAAALPHHYCWPVPQTRFRLPVVALYGILTVSILTAGAPTAWATTPTSHIVPGHQAGVSCLSRSLCVLVGYNSQSTGDVVVLRDGVPVRQAAVPGSKALYSVSCSEGAGCVAAGENTNDTQLMLVTLNSSGAIVSTKSLTLQTGVTLTRISCVTTSSCALSGDDIFVSPAGLDIGHWDGHAVTVSQVPAPTGTSAPSLQAVSCSGTNCVAVGSAFKGVNVDGLVLRSVGWAKPQLYVVPNYSLYGVSCVSGSLCYAAGSTRTGGIVIPVTNGKAGTAATAGADLMGIACRASTCVSAGEKLAPPGAARNDNYYGALVTTVAGKITSTQLVAASGGYANIAQYGGSFVALGASQGQIIGTGSAVTTGKV